MSQRLDEYHEPLLDRGMLAAFLRIMRLPRTPPTLPGSDTSTFQTLIPDRRYLLFLRVEALFSGLGLSAIAAIAATILHFAFNMTHAATALFVVSGLFFLGMIFSILLAPIKYRSHWYCMGDRSMRLRDGLWTLTEVTITYDNIQDVTISQGPLMRLFGFHTIEIKTAGGLATSSRPRNPCLFWFAIVLDVALSLTPAGGAGASISGAGGDDKKTAKPTGLLIGIRNPKELRDHIMSRVRESQSAGLGDERNGGRSHRTSVRTAVRPDHLAELRAIRDALAAA